MSNDIPKTVTEKIDARLAEHVRKEKAKVDAVKSEDDQPITRKNVKLVWGVVVFLLGAMGTATTVVLAAFDSAASERAERAKLIEDVAALKTWKKEFVKEDNKEDRELQNTLSGIKNELTAIRVRLDIAYPK